MQLLLQDVVCTITATNTTVQFLHGCLPAPPVPLLVYRHLSMTRSLLPHVPPVRARLAAWPGLLRRGGDAASSVSSWPALGSS